MVVELKIKNSFPETLGINRYYQLEHQILNGRSSRSLARDLRKEGFYTSIKIESLAQKIRKYRKETILPKAKRLLDIGSSTNTTIADRAISEQRNVAFGLSRLIEIQLGRVNSFLGDEEDSGERKPFVTRELKFLKDLYVSVGQFQLKAGLIGTMRSHDLGYDNDPERYKRIQNSVKELETRRQVADATRKAMKI